MILCCTTTVVLLHRILPLKLRNVWCERTPRTFLHCSQCHKLCSTLTPTQQANSRYHFITGKMYSTIQYSSSSVQLCCWLCNRDVFIATATQASMIASNFVSRKYSMSKAVTTTVTECCAFDAVCETIINYSSTEC